MKSITLLLLIISVLTLNAEIKKQEINIPCLNFRNSKKIGIDINTSVEAVSVVNFPKINLTNDPDTLSQYLDRAAGAVVYTYNLQGNDFPIMGSNTFYLMLGQKFQIEPDRKLKGLLVPYFHTEIQGDVDSLSIMIFEIDPANGFTTGDPLVQKRFTLENANSSTNGPVFTYYDIPGDISLPEHFVVFFQTRSGTNQDDGIVLYSSMQGDGQGENNACFITYDQQTQTTIMANIDQLPLQLNNSPIDFDALLLPVVDYSTGVNEISTPTFQIGSIYPNPTTESVTIDGIKSDCNLSVEILDMTGKKVQTPDFERSTDKIVIPGTELPSGVYILKISDGKTVSSGIINIVK